VVFIGAGQELKQLAIDWHFGIVGLDRHVNIRLTCSAQLIQGFPPAREHASSSNLLGRSACPCCPSKIRLALRRCRSSPGYRRRSCAGTTRSSGRHTVAPESWCSTSPSIVRPRCGASSRRRASSRGRRRSEEHTSELQSRGHLVC